MAALWRYENIAARKHHEDCDRDLGRRIAMAEPPEAEALRAHRVNLRRAGLWAPTLPGPREAAAICRYQGKLDRTIRAAMSDLRGLKATREASAWHLKTEKQTHFIEENQRISGYSHGAKGTISGSIGANHARASSGVLRPSPQAPPALAEKIESAKTNPLNARSTGTLTGNRHQRRQAQALARRRRC
jgi:hypothetical protein